MHNEISKSQLLYFLLTLPLFELAEKRIGLNYMKNTLLKIFITIESTAST